MPRYSGVLAFICLVSICVGVNIIRYPAVADMLNGEDVCVKNSHSPNRNDKIKDSQSRDIPATSSYRSYSIGESDSKNNSYGNKPISSSGTDSYSKSSYGSSGYSSGSSSSSSYGGYSSGSSGDKDKDSGSSQSSGTDSYSKSSYESSGYSSGSSSSSSYGGYSSGSSGDKDDDNDSGLYNKSLSDKADEVSQSSQYQTGRINPGYASHYSSGYLSADPASTGRNPDNILSAAERFEQQKQQPFSIINRETRESTLEATHYIPPSFSANGSSLAVPTLPLSTSMSFETIPLPPVVQE